LDYFSKFDWENYCVSLNGPVCKSSLPDIVGKRYPFVPVMLDGSLCIVLVSKFPLSLKLKYQIMEGMMYC
jgi:hypothetical protein